MDYAHKVSMFLYKGIKTDENLHVLHICDNPKCVNPDHLRTGSHTDNMRDMFKKGRNRVSSQKLTQDQVNEIRKLRSQGYQIKEIAKKYNMDRGHTSRLCKGCLLKGTRPQDKNL